MILLASLFGRQQYKKGARKQLFEVFVESDQGFGQTKRERREMSIGNRIHDESSITYQRAKRLPFIGRRKELYTFSFE